MAGVGHRRPAADVWHFVGEGEAREMGEALARGGFTMEEFLKQMRMIRKLGPLEKVLGMVPGMGGMMKSLGSRDIEGELARKEAIVNSMTRQERRKPKILNGSRRSRIAAGSGTTVTDVNRFLKEFGMMEKMMRRLGRGGAGAGLLKGLTGQTFS